MKTKVIIIIIIILIGIGGLYHMGRKRKVKEKDLEISNIKSFYFTYTNGYMINSYTRYQIVIEEEKYIAKIKPYGKSEDEEKEIEINQDFIEKIVTILKKI